MFKEKTWKDGENQARQYMKENGYKILWTNFSCVGVELDIVAILPKKVQIQKLKKSYKERIKTDKENKKLYSRSLKGYLKTIEDLLIITEVKARETDKYGLGMDAVTEYKKHNIIRGARFLQKDKNLSKYQIRFDVASVDKGELTYIEGAF